MQILVNGFTAIANGAAATLGHLISPVALAIIASAVSLAWLARLEVDELDRQGTKPQVGKH